MFRIMATEDEPHDMNFGGGRGYKGSDSYEWMDRQLERVLQFDYGAVRGKMLGTGALGGVAELKVIDDSSEVMQLKLQKLREYLRTATPVIKYGKDKEEAEFADMLATQYEAAQKGKPFARPPPVCMPNIARVYSIESPQGDTYYAIIREDIQDTSQFSTLFDKTWVDLMVRRLAYTPDDAQAVSVVVSKFTSYLYKVQSELIKRCRDMAYGMGSNRSTALVWYKKFINELDDEMSTMNHVLDIAHSGAQGTSLESQKAEKAIEDHLTETAGLVFNPRKPVELAIKMLLRLYADLIDLFTWLASQRIYFSDMHHENIGCALTETSNGARVRIVYRDLGFVEDRIEYGRRKEPWAGDAYDNLAGFPTGTWRGMARRNYR